MDDAEPQAGWSPTPILLIGLFALLVFWGFVYLENHGGGFKGQVYSPYMNYAALDADQPPHVVDPKVLGEACPALKIAAYDFALAGSAYRFGDYEVGEKIDHVDGITVEEAEAQIATRLYQNTARIHFNQYIEGKGRFGRRLIYGGHVISLARSLSFNGLANAFHVAAINGGRHVAPLFAGGTVFAWSEILAKAELPGRDDVGALRLRTVATRDRPCEDFPLKTGEDYDPAVLLDLDYWVLMPR